jgi:hypothetical protein
MADSTGGRAVGEGVAVDVRFTNGSQNPQAGPSREGVGGGGPAIPISTANGIQSRYPDQTAPSTTIDTGMADEDQDESQATTVGTASAPNPRGGKTQSASKKNRTRKNRTGR